MPYVRYVGFITIVLIVMYGLYKGVLQSAPNIKSRLGSVKEQTPDTTNVQPADIQTPIDKYIASGALYRIPGIGKYFEKQLAALKHANVPLKPSEYFIATVVIPILMFFLVFFVLGSPMIASIFVGVGIILPNVYISHLSKKRQKKLNQQLPEFLTILSNGIRSGLSLNQAIDLSIKELQDPIRWEFGKMLADINLGRDTDQALTDLAERGKNENLTMFTNAVIVQRQIGGNLSEVLDIIAETIRARIRLQRKITALTAQNKMSGLIIALIPIGIAVAVMVIRPEYILPLFLDPIGQILLVLMVISIGIAAFLLNKVTTLEV